MSIYINFPTYKSEHSSQIITGFMGLSALIHDPSSNHDFLKDFSQSIRESITEKLQFSYKPQLLEEFNNNNNILEVIIDGVRLIYDTDDGYNILSLDSFDHALDHVDYYFKRSFRSSLHQQLRNRDKIHPLGLNYYVTIPGNPLDQPAFSHLPLKASMKKLLRRLPGRHFSYSSFYESRFTSAFDYNSESPQILFISRLWKYHPEHNAHRIDCVKALRKHYKDHPLICGIIDGPIARTQCPELILDQEITKKSNYLKTMIDSSICITTTGLFDSIGWKFAEYVAASKVIVTEPLLYELPGNFKEGSNYLTFNDSASLIKSIDMLLDSKELQEEISIANHNYYKQYMQPSQLISNTIKLIN